MQASGVLDTPAHEGLKLNNFFIEIFTFDKSYVILISRVIFYVKVGLLNNDYIEKDPQPLFFDGPFGYVTKHC